MFFIKSNKERKPYLKRIFTKQSTGILIIAACAFVFLNFYRLNNPIPVGYKIDDFKLQDSAGIELALSDISMPTVILFYEKRIFFANFMFNHFYLKQLTPLKFLQDNELAYVLVISKGYDTTEKLNELIKDKKHHILSEIGYTTTDEKKLAELFGVRSYPHIFVLNKEHVVIFEAKLATAEYIKKVLWR